MERNAIVVVVAVVVAVAAVGFVAYQLLYFGGSYENAVSSELSDKCATPPGYTDEAWTEHMSHHPDRYAGCLADER